MKNKTLLYNIFSLPLIVLLIQFIFVFLALFNSGYTFANNVIIFSVSVLLLWLILYIIFEVNNKTLFKNNKIKIILFCSGCLLGFYFVYLIWFSRTDALNIEPVAALLNGKTAMDTAFHSAIAESFITNGYPSVQLNHPELYAYHCLSHFIVSCFSRILNIPVLIVYNYIVPVFFIPLFILMFNYVVFAFRKRYNYENVFPLKDILFILCFFLSFNLFQIADKFNIFFIKNIASESYFISIILILLFLIICLSVPEDSKIFKIIFSLILFPAFIFLISYCKISSGLIFYLSIAYYLFRKNPKSIKSWFVIILNGLVFILSYRFFNGYFHTFTNPYVNNSSSSLFLLLHYARTFLPKKFWLLHYIFYIIPAIFLFKFSTKNKLFSKEYFLDSSNLWAEMAVLLTVGSWLPGLIFPIPDGSSEYFCYPAFIISIILFWGTNCHVRIYEALLKKHDLNYLIALLLSLCVILTKNVISITLLAFLIILGLSYENIFINKYKIISSKIKKENIKKYIIIFIMFVSLFIPELIKSQIFHNVHETITYSNKNQLEKMSTEMGFSNRIKKVLFCFNKSEYIDDERYKTIKNLRDLINQDRKSYCVYMCDDCFLHELYDSTSLSHTVMKVHFVCAGILGVPVINALYTDGTNFYKSNGVILPQGLFGYGLSSFLPHSKKLTLEDARDYAKTLGKSKIIVLSNNSYDIIDVL